MKFIEHNLRVARVLIQDQRAWVQGKDMVYGEAKYSLLGALHFVGYDMLDRDVAVMVMCEALGLAPDLGLDDAHACIDLLRSWHDAPQRTHAEVLAALDRAIALCE